MKFLLTLFATGGILNSSNAQTPLITVSEKWVALSPTLLFLLILSMVFIKLKKDKVSLRDLLLDKDALIQIEVQKTEQLKSLKNANLLADPNIAQVVKNIVEPENPDEGTKNASVSRFLAFISGLVSVGIASTVTSFYMWTFFNDEKNVDLNKLLTVLLSLGIGVVPYAFNKISAAVK